MEVNPAAVEDARRNAARNAIANATFLQVLRRRAVRTAAAPAAPPPLPCSPSVAGRLAGLQFKARSQRLMPPPTVWRAG